MDEPRWDLLPRHPRRFFDLAEDFDRRDLKRAYRDLVKRYKPDKAPDEFQKIRAAYEHLTDRLAGKKSAPPLPESVPLRSRQIDRQERLIPPPTEPPEQLRELARSGSAWNVFVQAQPLWQRLAQEYPFATNAEVLRDCTAAVGDNLALDSKASQARTLAVLAMVRRMLFKAQPSWNDEHLAFLEEHHLDLPENFQDRIDLLVELASYAKVRETHVQDPVHRSLDALVLAYSELEPADFRLFVEEKATALVSDPVAFHESLQSAALSSESSLGRTLETLHRLITHLGLVRRVEMEGRFAAPISPSEAVPQLLEELERETLEDLDDHPTKLVKSVRFDTFVARLFFSSLLGLLFMPVLKVLYWERFGNAGGWVVYGEYLMYLLAGALWVGSLWPSVLHSSFRKNLALQTEEKTWPFYAKLWRPWVFRFLAKSRTPLLPLLKELSPLAEAQEPFWTAGWLFEPLKQDLGAWLFADLACLAR